MARSALVLRTATVAAVLAALAGCSFSGSADDPDAGGTPRSSSAAASSSSSAPSSSGTTAPSSSTGGGQAAGGQTSSGQASSGQTSGGKPASGQGSGGKPASGQGSGGGSGAQGAAGIDRCHTSELTGSLVPGDPGAGQRHATLVLTDTGGETCTIDGYGGIGLVDAAGRALPTKQVRVASPAPKLITLRPGATVRAQLQWGAVPGTGDSTTGDCQPTAAALQVIPPDETDALRVAWSGGPVCEGGTIQQQAYVAG